MNMGLACESSQAAPPHGSQPFGSKQLLIFPARQREAHHHLLAGVEGFAERLVFINSQVAELPRTGGDLSVVSEIPGHLFIVRSGENRREVEVGTDPGDDRRLGILGGQPLCSVAVHEPPPWNVVFPNRVRLI